MKVNNLIKYIKEQNQRVIITYIEGTMSFIVYKLLTNTFEKIEPIVSQEIKFKALPYNSRHCNIANQNKIFITGGLQNELTACFYDYDINLLGELPDMKYEKFSHTMIGLYDELFVLGGHSSSKVEVYHTEFEDWNDLPDLNYDRQDPGICIINDNILYVFMGYSYIEGRMLKNFEKLHLDNRQKGWKLLSVFNPIDLNAITTHCAIFPYENGVIIFGGFKEGNSVDSVTFFHLESYVLSRIPIKMPFTTAFQEKSFYTLDNSDYYIFTWGSNRLLNFKPDKLTLKEII